MSDKKNKKKHVLLWIIFLLIFFIIIGSFVLYQRRKINNTEVLQNYRVSCTDTAADSADFLIQLCQDKLQFKLNRATESSHLFLALAGSESEAEDYGFSLQGLEDKGFLIVHHGNTVYLLSKTPEGLQRACYRLIYGLTDETGKLLLALDERCVDTGSRVRDEILIDDTSIENYSVICPEGISPSYGRDLIYYITQACGAVPDIVKTDTASPSIRLSLDTSLPENSYKLEGSDGNIIIAASDEEALSDGIYQFANTWLGWMYAGTDRETLGSGSGSIHIPADITADENPWMEEREAIITLWNVNYSRGIFLNNSTSLKNDIMSFSDEQLYDYVKMLKYCGFTGIQATDMCSAWAGAGSYEYVHERLRILADAAHSLDMKFTLWVWGAEFTGYGWVDNSVTYSSDGYEFAFQNPDVIATFEKYYSIYAELADCCDRVIAHYYDPGQLTYSEDVAYFARMLAEKFRTINPDVDFGISCWIDFYNKNEFIRELGNNITLYENGHHDTLDDYIDFRNFCAENGCRLGTWAWNTCEMEIDQLAQMNFNPHIIQSVYQASMKYDEIMKPEYWSEMDSYHVLNVFSLYCAGQLLIDPSRDVEELTHEASLAAVGSEYADDFADILALIEEARSGESWDTYWWNSENYILKSDSYPAEDILTRCDKAISVLQEMINSGLQTNTLPLPLELNEVLQLILPHIQQIKAYAEFRIGFAQAEDMLANGASAADIQAQIDSISTPISEYNTVIGAWGQVEARAQQELLWDFCQENNLEMPVDSTFDRERKFRIYSEFITNQKGKQWPVYRYAPHYQNGQAFGNETTIRLINELVDEGLLTLDETTYGVYLTDWEHYIYSFN